MRRNDAARLRGGEARRQRRARPYETGGRAVRSSSNASRISRRRESALLADLDACSCTARRRNACRAPRCARRQRRRAGRGLRAAHRRRGLFRRDLLAHEPDSCDAVPRCATTPRGRFRSCCALRRPARRRTSTSGSPRRPSRAEPPAQIPLAGLGNIRELKKPRAPGAPGRRPARGKGNPPRRDERELVGLSCPRDEPLVKQGDLLALPLRRGARGIQDARRAYLPAAAADLQTQSRTGGSRMRVGMERTHLYRKLPRSASTPPDRGRLSGHERG